MRALIDIPEADLANLTVIARRRRISRAAVVREAVALLLAKTRPNAIESYFGLWSKNEPEDGLAFQRRLREEW